MDISALRERPNSSRMSVSELNDFIKKVFENTSLLRAVSVSGEISNFVRHRSGHLYFSLKDDTGQIKAVMFSSSAQNLKFEPENGMKVTVRGSVSVYVKDGTYQLYVKTMQPDGIGELYLAYERLKAKLSAEGLFDQYRKKDIPRFPKAIGVVTSPTGAAVRDIINILRRRYPMAKVYVYPALVQGEGAEASLIKGVDYFDTSGLVDTIIVGRGGGSIEDLWAFNSEALARRISSANIPIISAVGHEPDFTICDFVSDLRAPTPSAAAELCSVDINELFISIDVMSDRCDRAILNRVERLKERFERVKESSVFLQPKLLFADKRVCLEQLSNRVVERITRLVKEKRADLSIIVAKLDGLSPLSALARGFLIAERDGKTIATSRSVEKGDEITLRFADGKRRAKMVD